MKPAISELNAKKIARAIGLRVTTTAKTGSLRQMMVGKLLVQHDEKYCADQWKVGDISVGTKGEAIAVAAEAQGPMNYPFTPDSGSRMMRAFIEIRKAHPELRAH